MRVLVACEESQRVCIAFRKRGHEAYSCDIIECSGGHPEWHIKGDALGYINGNCQFVTEGGATVNIVGKWDLLIAHPPCTYLTVTGNRWFNVERYGEQAITRIAEREKAAAFFMKMINADCDMIAVENPIGAMSTLYRKPNQIIQPFFFGDPHRKSTCLWLKNLPCLTPTNIVEVDKSDEYEYIAKNGRVKHDSRYRSKCGKEERSRYRSKTFPGIAEAMAEQWGGITNA